MSAEDREVLREVWEGRIPAVFNLAEPDIDHSDEEQNDEPTPFYLMLPRMSYLPLATDKVLKHFSKYSVDKNPGNVWFDYKGSPLKWHHPIGALYDLFKGVPLDNDEGLPWQITVHMTNFPQQDLIPCTTREVIKSQYMSSVKEADQLKHAGKIVSNMKEKDHLQLWTGLQNDKFDQFWAINRRFMESPGQENFKNIPIRFHLSEKQSVVQKLVKPISENTGDSLTFGDLKEMFYPTSTLIIQGLQPSPETPVEWMSKHLSYPDNFLHIAVH